MRLSTSVRYDGSIDAAIRHQRIGREQDDPTDRLADMCEQLGWLSETDFEQVDCHFKWLELALIIAARGSGDAQLK
jgi:hypothetical protein